MTESTPERSRFLTVIGVPLVAAFDGGRFTSGESLPRLAQHE